MKVQLDKTYDLPGSAEQAWAVLSDVPRVAGCMPGARISERVDATHYKGTVAVKFGPAALNFRGEVEVLALDAATKMLRLVGKGTDSTGGSGASMDITARIEAVDGANSKLVGQSEVSMSGKAAAFGSRLAGAVADQVLGQFVGNFSKEVSTQAATAALEAAGEPPAPPARVAPGATAASAAAALPAGATAAAPGASTATASAPRSAAPEPAPLSATGLAWGMLKSWLSSLFGARKA